MKTQSFFLFVALNEHKDRAARPRRGEVAVMRGIDTPPTDTEKKVFLILAMELDAKQEKQIREEISAPFARRLNLGAKKLLGMTAKTRESLDKKKASVEPISATFEDLEAATRKPAK